MPGPERGEGERRVEGWVAGAAFAALVVTGPATRRVRTRAEIDQEREGWYELVSLVRLLTPEECLEPGYYRDPVWTVRDLVAHIGTWLAEAQIQFERIGAGSYEGHDVDVEALNVAPLDGMAGQPWDVA